MGCISCGRDFHDECLNEEGCENCHDEVIKRASRIQSLTFGGGKGHKPDDQVTDRYSTGRKRAAIRYPLYLDQPCEWRGKKNCGGGIPIVGCLNGFQQDRHHGPIKDTLHNEQGNVHRICKKCHKRWHTTNDELYKEETWSETRHEPEEATEAELRSAELKWMTVPRGHIKIDAED